MFRRLRDLRKEYDLPQREVAAFLKMSQQQYSKYERGEKIPLCMIVKLADFYHVSVDYLLGRTDDPTRPQCG